MAGAEAGRPVGGGNDAVPGLGEVGGGGGCPQFGVEAGVAGRALGAGGEGGVDNRGAGVPDTEDDVGDGVTGGVDSRGGGVTGELDKRGVGVSANGLEFAGAGAGGGGYDEESVGLVGTRGA